MSDKRTLATLLFPDFELLDVFGPLEMFGLLPDEFEIVMVGEAAGPIASRQGPKTVAELSIAESSPFDLLLVPGGMGTRRQVENENLLQWIAAQAGSAELVLSVCTGSSLLARAGVLDGARATTNKAAFQWVSEQGPDVFWQKKARWVEDGCFFTSSGVSAGIDMSLAAIARLHGTDRAEEVALWAEYDWHRDPDWDPFAEKHGLV